METFNSRYSSWFLPLSAKQRGQYERLERLVLNFNENLKEEVTRAKDKYNLKVRSVIAEKTGVSLTFKTKEHDLLFSNNNEKVSIPIKIVDSVPISLLELFDKFDDNHIELLLHYRRMQRTVFELEYQIEKYTAFLPFHHEVVRVEELKRTILHLQNLIREVENCGIIQAIQTLGPDLLGAYFLKDNRVELYWLCIGLCNALYDLPVEDFTLVVLIHELVHGYTHIGFDKDGNKWETIDFDYADLRIVEGFSQFYTEMLCRDYFEQATSAFNALLADQSLEYTDYKHWFGEKEPNKYEKARRILLKTRNNKVKDYATFWEHLHKIKDEF